MAFTPLVKGGPNWDETVNRNFADVEKHLYYQEINILKGENILMAIKRCVIAGHMAGQLGWWRNPAETNMDSPNNAPWGVVEYAKHATGYITVRFTEDRGQSSWLRQIFTETWTWADTWFLGAIAAPPQDFDLSLAPDVTNAYGISTYSKAQNSLALVTVNARFNRPTNHIEIIANLPVGYRPSKVIGGICFTKTQPGDKFHIGSLEAYPNGIVQVYTDIAGFRDLSGQIAFHAV